MRITAGILILSLGLTACGEDGTGPEGDSCDLVSLPLAGSASGPVVQSVKLEVQPGEGVVVLATAVDPQGTEGLLGVEQTISVFTNTACAGIPLRVTDDLAGSGVEESFGTAVGASSELSLFLAIADTTAWPVEVDLADVDGNRTQGRVLATVVR